MSQSFTIIHVNLTKNFRGGERQTLLLIRQIQDDYPCIQQILVANPQGRLFQEVKSLSTVVLIAARSQLTGHYTIPNSGNSVVHAHEARAVHWAYLQWILRKTPYIITRRVQDPIKQHWLTNSTYRSAAIRVAISKWIQTHLLERSFEAILIPSSYDSSIDYDDGTSSPKSSHTSLVQLGALVDAHKGQSTSIRALANLSSDYSLTLIGDGPDRESLQELVRDLGLEERVTFKPWADEEVQNLKNYDIFLMPSMHEGLGSIVLQAMRAKIPIIATQVGGLTDLISHLETGLLLPPNDPERLSEYITEIKTKTELRRSLTYEAALKVRKYSPKNMATAYVKLYNEVASQCH